MVCRVAGEGILVLMMVVDRGFVVFACRCTSSTQLNEGF